MADRPKLDFPEHVNFGQVFNLLPKQAQERLRINYRIQQVHGYYQKVVEPFLCEHTNSVYQFKNEDGTQDLVVYVDESIYAAELNARRELIKMRYLQEFGIEIREFDIRISKGEYRKNHPFAKQNEALENNAHTRELTSEELSDIELLISTLEEGRLKDSFRELLITHKQNS